MQSAQYCASTTCPRLRNESLPYRVPSGEMSQDQAGHFWCNLCSNQLAVMDWSYSQNWPDAYVQGEMRYAVASGAQSWFESVAFASRDMVVALYETLVTRRRTPLSADDSAHVRRVLDLIEE